MPAEEKPDEKDPTKPKKPSVWHHQQMIILKEWSEKASGYRWMHERAAARYKTMHMNFSLPVIILSTIAGTANFAQSSFTGVLAAWGPQIIGGINLVAGMITTIAQFMKIGELMEGHRVASIGFGKFSRSISVELALPPADRSMDGDLFLDKMRKEFDALIEMSPSIPVDLGKLYLQTIKDLEAANPSKPKIALPETLEVRGVLMYEPTVEEKAADVVQHAAGKLMSGGLLGKIREKAKTEKKASFVGPASGGVEDNKAAVELELAALKKTGAVKALAKPTKLPPPPPTDIEEMLTANAPTAVKELQQKIKTGQIAVAETTETTKEDLTEKVTGDEAV